jgi:hypothetical protein
MPTTNIKVDYLIGIISFIGATIFYSFIGNFINKILYYFPYPSNQIVSIIFYFTVIIFLGRILYKRSKYMGLGYFLALPAALLFFALFFLELWLHPPDEE